MKEDEEKTKNKRSNKTQQTLQATLLKSTKYDSNSHRQNSLDNALLEMVATDMQPCSIVEDKGFIQ